MVHLCGNTTFLYICIQLKFCFEPITGYFYPQKNGDRNRSKLDILRCYLIFDFDGVVAFALDGWEVYEDAGETRASLAFDILC